jgi:hypothetical protein
MFHYEGSRTDKHVRDHEIYTVQASTSALQRSTAARPGERKSGGGAIVLDRLTQSAAVVTSNLRRKPRLGTGVAVIAILSVAVGLRLARQPAAAPVPPPAPAPPKVAAAAAKPAPQAPVQQKADAQAKPATPPAKQAAAPARPKPATKQPAAPALEDETAVAPKVVASAAKPATVSFAISPWGEVRINGKVHGIAPPLRDVDLPPGRHRIEIRNAGFPPHIEIVDAKPGGKIRIRHKFQN